jgi:hypothetical protein
MEQSDGVRITCPELLTKRKMAIAERLTAKSLIGGMT